MVAIIYVGEKFVYLASKILRGRLPGAGEEFDVLHVAIDIKSPLKRLKLDTHRSTSNLAPYEAWVNLALIRPP